MRLKTMVEVAAFFMGMWLVSFSGGSAAFSSQDRPYRIFILHSYEPGHVCGQAQHDGVVAALKAAGFRENVNLEIQSYFMDTKRRNNTAELMEEQADLALEKIGAFKPNVIVTLDDNAFSTVALKLVDTDAKIVFSGINNPLEEYNRIVPYLSSRARPGHNVSGVCEKLHIADALRVHSNLFPGLKKIMIFVDTSPTGRGAFKQINMELKQASVPCTWEIKVAKTWEEYRSEVLSVNDDSDVGAIYPAALLLKDRKGNIYTAPEIFAWTIENSKKPEIAANYAFTRMGFFGGAAVDFFAMGQQAGRMAAMILKGRDPGTIAVEEANRYALVFNLQRAEKLGIEIPLDVLMAADEIIPPNR
jgi:ABC-type uncharacterized transport system substrate-binding protein